MRIFKTILTTAVALTALGTVSWGDGLSATQKASIEGKIKVLSRWSTDPMLVAAVKEQNAKPRADAKDMTNEKWKSLTIMDPLVRSFGKTPLALNMKAKKEEFITECFVSAADGTKVAFFAKTTNWTHAGKDKHKVPMSGKPYIGPLEIDESTGLQQVQVGLPVLDGGTPIGSIVFGMNAVSLK